MSEITLSDISVNYKCNRNIAIEILNANIESGNIIERKFNREYRIVSQLILPNRLEIIENYLVEIITKEEFDFDNYDYLTIRDNIIDKNAINISEIYKYCCLYVIAQQIIKSAINKHKFVKFIMLRFKEDLEMSIKFDTWSYIRIWANRFNSKMIESYMDYESLEIYNSI